MSIYNKVPHQRKASMVLTLFALAFTVSSIPGLHSNLQELGSTDLSSQIRSCDIEGQIRRDGNADCNSSMSTDSKAVQGSVHIEEVVATDATEAGYIITGEFKTTCSFCEDGVRVTPLDTSVSTIAEAHRYLEEQASELARTTKEEEDIENCKIDPDTREQLTRVESLQCRIDKMAQMDERSARRYYDQHIKNALSTMAQSQNVEEAKLAASLAGEVQSALGVNCNAMMAQMRQTQIAGTQPFNPLAAPSTSYHSTPTDYIRDSSCDIMAMGNYNAHLLFLGTQLNGPNGTAVARQITAVQQQWGGYFNSRGLVLQHPTLTQINYDAGTLMTQLSDFNRQFNENYDAILKRHEGLLQAGTGTTQGAPSLSTAGAGGGDGRLLRGGGIPAENGNQSGMPSLLPWPGQGGGAAPAGGAVQNRANGGQAPAILAPTMGTPVGS